jgi:PST family polysaccharide transporter
MDRALIAPSLCPAALRAFAEPVCRHLGWFGFFLVLAPIVGPRGYGLFALALSGIAIAEALLAATAVQVLVDSERLDERHLSTALVATVAAGAAMSLVLYAAAGRIGAMLDEAPLADIFQSLTLLPMLGALTVVPTARLRRDGRQAPFAAATISGLATGGGAGVALAWAGAGPWSLVAQIVVQRFIECAVLWIMAGRGVGLGWSRTHFAELNARLDLHALAAVWPAVARHGPCLLIGLSLGPVATGLYMIAARCAEAISDIARALPWPRAPVPPAEIARRVGLVAFPAMLGSASLAIIAPALLDARWWGAVPAAQLLTIAAIPAALSYARTVTARDRPGEARWQAAQGIAGLAVVALAVPYGLVAVAAAALAHAAAFGLASLWPIRRRLAGDWRSGLEQATRSLTAACATGLLLFALAEPVALALAPVPALCLLAGASRLCYLVIRGGTKPGRPALALRRAEPA